MTIKTKISAEGYPETELSEGMEMCALGYIYGNDTNYQAMAETFA